MVIVPRTIPFAGFPKIPRLRKDCVITEKLDGTNAQVYVSTEGGVIAGSRNRWVWPGQDNYGFGAWVAAHAEELVALGPGHHYGEWWGHGIQRGYGLPEKRFSLFNTSRWLNNPNLPDCCSVVPELYRGEFSTEMVNDVMRTLEVEGSVAAPGFERPEGVIVYHTGSGTTFKQTFGGDKK